MTTFGYFLSTEEHGPLSLLEQAERAERAGFDALWVSDHYHPWNDAQGQAPFVWSVLGAIAARTERVRCTTAVTAPTVRLHPAVIAQAAAQPARPARTPRHDHGVDRHARERPGDDTVTMWWAGRQITVSIATLARGSPAAR